MKEKGKVYLVGAGPGDPELITVKGLKLLQTCDVVIYDRLASPRLLSYTKPNCEKIYVGKEVGNHAMKQEDINKILIEKALSGTCVVRLKGGDPFVFGRGGEELLALKEHGITYEVIPGITSAIAAATYAGIPITHRGTSQSFHVITGHTAMEDTTLPEDIKSLAGLNGTLVILMGLGNLENICDTLLENGKSIDTPVAVIAEATTLWQQEVRGTLKDISQKVKEAGITSPAVIIIGDVAAYDFREKEQGVLSGIRVGITGTKTVSDKLAVQLEEMGAKATNIYTSELREFTDNKEFDQALRNMGQYRWVVLTSTNAVHITFRRWKVLRIDLRSLAQIKFAVVGSGTEQALREYGYLADLVPEQYNVNCLATQLCKVVKGDERILIPRARQGSDALVEILKNEQKIFDDVKIYDVEATGTISESFKNRADSFDYITFASSSGVHGFIKGLEGQDRISFKNTRIVCIGDATEETLKEYGYNEVLLAKEASVTGLVNCIKEDHLHRLQ